MRSRFASICTSLAAVLLWLPATTLAQDGLAAHRPAANQLIDAALRDSAAYARLAVLVDRFGHRISGSVSLERAIEDHRLMDQVYGSVTRADGP